VEGINIGGILIGYLAVLVFGVISLVAVGLLIARLTKAARITFAAGLLGADMIAAFAALTFLDNQFNHDGSDTSLIIVTALSMLLGGAGQFIAALRRPWIYATALASTAGSVMFLAAPLLGGNADHQLFGGLHLRLSPHLTLGLSLLLAVTSLIIAVLYPSGPRRTLTKRPAVQS
jgi:hypothetical protein